MSITKTPKGWKVDCRPSGRDGKRYRKYFPTKIEATRYESYLRTRHTETPDWEPRSKDTRLLSDLISEWYEGYGKSLKSGQHRVNVLNQVCLSLGNPRASKLDGQDFTDYRSLRLAEGIAPNTLNHELAYLRAVFNEHERSGSWTLGNPIGKVRQLRVPDTELYFLNHKEISILFNAISNGTNPDTKNVAAICLATGARWSEAESLRGEQVSQDLITFTDTKSGKNRSVPVERSLSESIRKFDKGRLFEGCYSSFRNAIKRADIALPKGQLSHVLRHTFASHFMMNGGNIIVLQRILGHANLTMTMRYAHFSPDHLEEAKRFNPIAKMDLLS